MEYQGTPVGGSNDGQKVTTDPRSRKTINEGTGGVAADSLAAESYRQGGGFAANPNSRPSDVPGGASTWNNTDTSGADILSATRDASGRGEYGLSGGGFSGSARYPEGTGYSGLNTATGGATSSSDYSSDRGNTGAYSGSGADTYDGSGASTAPNYALNQQGAFQSSKPKGQNLTEGGFGDNSFRRDPGQSSLEDPQRIINNSVTGSDPSGGSTNQPYGNLGRDERA